MATLPDGGVLRRLREELDEEDPPLSPPPPAPAAAAATLPVGVGGTAGLGLERLEAAMPTPAGAALVEGGVRMVSK